VTIHCDLAAERWHTLEFVEQMANVGSEVGRALRSQRAGNRELSQRALELFDLTSVDLRWRGPRLREIRRAREEFCRLYLDEEEEGSWAGFEKYFLAFAIAARRPRRLSGRAAPTTRPAP